MAAELHLAEDALALHFLLQHLEGLVDIVVTDENLHASFLFNRAVDGPGGTRDTHQGQFSGCFRACRRHKSCQSEVAETFFGKLPEKAILAGVCQVVVPKVKNNRSRAVICRLERVIGSRRVTYFTPCGPI